MTRPRMDCNCQQCRTAGRYAAAADVAAELDYGPSSAHREEDRDPPDDDEALDEAGYAMHRNAGRYEGLTDDEGNANADERLDADGRLGHHNAAAWDSEGDDDFDQGDDEEATTEDFESALDVGQYDVELDDEAADEAWEADDDFREAEVTTSMRMTTMRSTPRKHSMIGYRQSPTHSIRSSETIPAASFGEFACGEVRVAMIR